MSDDRWAELKEKISRRPAGPEYDPSYVISSALTEALMMVAERLDPALALSVAKLLEGRLEEMKTRQADHLRARSASH